MFCRKCGKEIPDDSEFCPKCGEKIILPDADSPNEAKKNFPTIKLVKETPSHPESPANEIPLKTTPNPFLAIVLNRKTKQILIGLGIVAAVIAVVVIIIVTTTANKKAREAEIEAHHEFTYHFTTYESGEEVCVIDGYNGGENEIVIPDTINYLPVCEISESAFKQCDITTLQIGANVTGIGNEAFRECANLTEIILADGDEIYIGESAFKDCSELISLENSERVGSFGAYSFYNCEKLSDCEFSNAGIGAYSFSKTALESVDLSNSHFYSGSATIAEADAGRAAFSNCKNLKTIDLGAINKIPMSLCWHSENLQTVEWSGLTNDNAEIGENAFEKCKSLSEFVSYDNGKRTTINRPKELTDLNSYLEVGFDAFSECGNFENDMLKYTYDDFRGMNIFKAERLLGVTYIQENETTYSCYGYPTFQIWGKPFSYSTEFSYDILSMEFGNTDIWLSQNGSCTDKIHLGMSRDTIKRILSENMNEPDHIYRDDSEMLEIYAKPKNSSWDYLGNWYRISFDKNGIACYCRICVDTV